MKIAIIIGTNRQDAKTRKVAKQYAEILEKYNTENLIIDLGNLPADFIVSALYENSGKNEDFNRFQQQVETSDKFVFIVPEYNASFPGVLKAFIDGLKYPGSFAGKKCALVGISSGPMGGNLALSHLTDIFNYMGMHVLALKPKLARIDKNMAEDKITDKLYLDLLESQATQLIGF
ncbi:MAG: NAD(P)H-dependent oxidoreductase [Cyclobacteriaceae bacterium]|nr:NAD(P)H-dependent oxidoreductase [Cyclobacteriaceae bacterium]